MLIIIIGILFLCGSIINYYLYKKLNEMDLENDEFEEDI